MMRLDMPVTPLAGGMWMWRGDGHSAADVCKVLQSTCQEACVRQWATPSSSAATAAAPVSYLPPSVLNCPPTASPSTTMSSVPSSAPVPVVSNDRRPKKDLAAPYRSVDPVTGRVWGVPNAGGRGQCFDCPKPAMPNNRRCQSCLRALAAAVYEQMASEDLAKLQCSFAAALAKLPDSKYKVFLLKDTEERLHQLYSQLQAGQISPAIQSQLLAIAEGISSGDHAAANRAVATLSTQHWEEHKDWLMCMKRLLLHAQH